MKKSDICLIVIAFVIIISRITFTTFAYFHPEVFIEKLFMVFDKPLIEMLEEEEAERKEKIERGEPVWGRDTMTIWNDKYDICKYYDNDEKLGDLGITEKGFSDCIITRIKDFKRRRDKLYIYSYDGYAVIDKENICRVFITVPEEDFSRGYSTDENGNKIKFYPLKVDHEKIIYLSSFEEFSEKEQKILKKLE